MIFIFHGTPLAKGQGLCDIDRVWLGVTLKISKNGDSYHGGIRPIFRQMGKSNYWFNSGVLSLFIFENFLSNSELCCIDIT